MSKTPMSDTIQAVRELIQYEYMFISTPKFTSEPVDETWEVHQVFHSWLDNGAHTFIVVFRRPWKAAR